MVRGPPRRDPRDRRRHDHARLDVRRRPQRRLARADRAGRGARGGARRAHRRVLGRRRGPRRPASRSATRSTTSCSGWEGPRPEAAAGTMDADARAVLRGATRLDASASAASCAQALSHRSWCAEHPEEPSNERLEFLGDAVLGIVVTDHVFRHYPQLQEGELAKVRASVVNAEVLAEVAADVALGPCLLLGKGEDASGGRAKTVDPRRRDGGDHRRGLPRRRDGRGPGRGAAAVRRAHHRGRDRPGRRRLQDAAAGARGAALRPAAALPGARRGTRTTRSGSSRRCCSAARPTDTARAGRRSRPSRPRHVAAWERVSAGEVADRGRGGAGCLSSLRSR